MSNDLGSLDAVLLVGGAGTRLRSMVADRPKPMADVGGRPFLEWLLVALRRQGVRRFIMCTGHMAEAVEAHFGDGHEWDAEIRCSRDPFPLGTGGAIRNALAQARSDRLLVLNGDSFSGVDVARLAQAHKLRRAKASLWVVPMEDCRRYGTVEIGDDGAVRAFREKSPELRSGLINAGAYLIDREAVETIPAGAAVSVEKDVFPGWVGRGLYAVTGGGPFLDIGTPESYAAAAEFFRREAAGGAGRRMEP